MNTTEEKYVSQSHVHKERGCRRQTNELRDSSSFAELEHLVRMNSQIRIT
jgi:hypothetical protein